MTSPSRHLRRHLPRALLCAGLGLCATVAVSWACALWSDEPAPPLMRFGQEHFDQPVTHIYDMERLGLVYRVAMVEFPEVENTPLDVGRLEPYRPIPNLIQERAPLVLVSPGGMSSSFVLQYTIGNSGGVYLASIDMLAGWPMPALRALVYDGGASRRATQPANPPQLAGLKPPRVFLSDAASARTLPISPIWIGLFANTAFYASLIWLTVLGFGLARRAYRTRRGLCAECGYELAGLTKCPECGTELPARESTTSVSLSRCLAVSPGTFAASLLPLRSTP